MATTSTSRPTVSAVGPHRISSVWLKIVMAVTGTVLALFVFAHMVGNLKVFVGAEDFDDYAHWLRVLLEPLFPYEGFLWVLRVALVVCLAAHVAAAFMLTRRARRARGEFRRKGMTTWKSFTGRTMLVSGILVLLFVVFHLLDLTTGTAPVASDDYQATTRQTSHAYANLVASFERPWVTVVYVLAMLVLFLHLAHGLWTLVQDYGATGHRTRAVLVAIAGIVSVLVVVVNITIPLSVLLGVVS